MKYLHAIEKLLLTAWVGGLWAIGYIAAPTLFSVLDDRKLAGALAGEMFHIVNWLGLICGVALLLLLLKRCGRTWRLWFVLAMVILVANSQFVLQPMMAELKLQGIVPGSDAASRFGMLHGVASILYLLTGLLGMAVVVADSKEKLTSHN